MNAPAIQKQGEVVSMSPDTFIQQAIEHNASVESLERLMTLKERHESNEARKAYIAAMQHFQAVKPTVTKSKEVKHGNTVVYRHATLQDIEKALKDPLEQCSLFYRFECYEQDDKTGVTCIVTHAGGHSERVSMSAGNDVSGSKSAIQAKGSAITYLQRYTLIGAFALTTADEDDDGQAAGDLPYQKIVEHNNALRDNLKVVAAIKEALEEQDYDSAAEYIDNMPADVKNALWLAPTKGGIFTTAERAFFKSDDYALARARVEQKDKERTKEAENSDG